MEAMITTPGPGLWIRIRHRFGPRMTEWMLAVITALWGVSLLLPGETFDGRLWSVLKTLFVDEDLLGYIMLFLGLLRIGGLIVNGARKQVTPWIRIVSAACGFMLFLALSVGIGLTGIISPSWLASYPVYALVELVNIYRAAHDAGESNAIP